jgi:hypothetical protein
MGYLSLFMKKSLPVTQLRFGMYVAELDRPWTDTPFMFQGFVLQTEEQLEALKKYCKSVFVDEDRSQAQEAPAPRPSYTVSVPVEREVLRAKSAHAGAHGAIRDVLGAVRASRALDAKSVEQAVNSMTESVLRNPDALLLFSQLQQKDDYAQSHALDVAVYMTTFAGSCSFRSSRSRFFATSASCRTSAS